MVYMPAMVGDPDTHNGDMTSPPVVPGHPIPSPPSHSSSDTFSPALFRESADAFKGKIIREFDPLKFLSVVFNYDSREVPSQIVVSAHDLAVYHESSHSRPKADPFHSGVAMHTLLQNIHNQIPSASDSLPGGGFRYNSGYSESQSSTVVFSPTERDDWDMIGTFVYVVRDDTYEFEVPSTNLSVTCTKSPRNSSLWGGNSKQPMKRTRVDMISDVVHGPQDVVHTSDPPSLHQDEIGPATRIISMLRHGVRQYATGIAIEDSLVTLYYGDHSGLLISSPFDLVEDLDLFVAAVAAISRAHSTQLGFSPYLYFSRDERGCHLAGTKIKFRDAKDDYGDRTGPMHFYIDTEDNRKVFKATPIGRSTKVVPVRTSKSRNAPSSEQYVWKTSYPQARLPTEDVTICNVTLALDEKRPEALKHVVRVLCSFSGSLCEAGLPRAFLGDLKHARPRSFCSMVMCSYNHISQLQSATDFKQVIIDTMKAHHWVWTDAEVLHQDISSNNIMYYVDNSKVVGVLCDFDLACKKDIIDRHVDEEKSIIDQIRRGRKLSPISGSGYTGTLQFLSCELLATHYRPVQVYRHDLESFFYLIVSHCATHDRQKRTYRYFRRWNEGADHRIGEAKARFLGQLPPHDVDALFNDYFMNADPEYKGIIDDWIRPLREVFHSAATNHWEACNEHWRDFVKRSYPTGRNITFNRFMQAIGQQPCGCCDDEPLDSEDEYMFLDSDEEEDSEGAQDQEDEEDEEDEDEDETDMDVDEEEDMYIQTENDDRDDEDMDDYDEGSDDGFEY